MALAAISCESSRLVYFIFLSTKSHNFHLVSRATAILGFFRCCCCQLDYILFFFFFQLSDGYRSGAVSFLMKSSITILRLASAFAIHANCDPFSAPECRGKASCQWRSARLRPLPDSNERRQYMYIYTSNPCIYIRDGTITALFPLSAVFFPSSL